ncbi:hypothetical protein [Streptomyces sp. H39-S7]|uniref:hypothetical protein n=1 Tax=Streptomyces sp. H39-S7 TaxID=3004357 RepID=UPI003FA72A10
MLAAHLRRQQARRFPRDTLVDVPASKLPDGNWTKLQSNVKFKSAFSVGNTAQGNPACPLA